MKKTVYGGKLKYKIMNRTFDLINQPFCSAIDAARQ